MRSLARPILSALISTPRALLPRSSPLLRSVRPSQSTPPSLPFPQQQQSRAFTQTTTRALARVQLIGRLAAEPEVVVTGTGQQIVKYAIGVGSGPAENRKTSWFKIAYFSRGEEDAVEKRLMGMGRG